MNRKLKKQFKKKINYDKKSKEITLIFSRTKLK